MRLPLVLVRTFFFIEWFSVDEMSGSFLLAFTNLREIKQIKALHEYLVLKTQSSLFSLLSISASTKKELSIFAFNRTWCQTPLYFNYHYCLTWVFWSTVTGVKDKYKQHNEENGDKNQQGNKPSALVYRSSWSLASCSEKEGKRQTQSTRNCRLFPSS